MTIYYCWFCQVPVDPKTYLSATHYEDKRTVRFCSQAHYQQYMELAQL